MGAWFPESTDAIEESDQPRDGRESLFLSVGISTPLRRGYIGLVHDLSQRKADFKCSIRANRSSGIEAGNSSVILASDVLAGVIGHERGCDKAEHCANRNVCGDRKRRVIGPEQPSGDQRRRAARDNGSKLIAQRRAAVAQPTGN